MTATSAPGRFAVRTMGEAPFGVLVPGARAALVVTEANPLTDLATLRKPQGVVVRGRWHDAAALAALRDGVAEAYAGR